MEQIAAHYKFLTNLVAAKEKRRQQIIKSARPQEIQAVVECVKLCTENKLPNGSNIRGKIRWKRAVLLLKHNRQVIKPALVAVLCGIIREAIQFIYS